MKVRSSSSGAKAPLAAVLVVAVAVGCGGAHSDGAPSPGDVTDKVGALTTSASGALMPFGGQNVTCVKAVGNQLQIAACNAGGETFVINGPTIQTNASPPLCLAIQNQDLTAGVATVTTCDSTPSQQWYFSGGQIVSVNNSDGQLHCLDVKNGVHAIGTLLDVATCNNTDAQVFWAAGFTMRIASTFSATAGNPPVTTPEYLDVLSDNETVGASLDDAVNNTMTNGQSFVLNTRQQITLANKPSLCVSRGTAQNGLAPVSLATCSTTDTKQKWFFSNKGLSGGHPVVSVGNNVGGCLDIQNGSQTSGTKVDDFTCNGTAAQLWQPTPATSSGNPWTKVAMAFPGGVNGPSNIALLTDGTVLASDPSLAIQGHNQPAPIPTDTSNRWFVLKPDAKGSYANGTWSATTPSNLGRWANPSFVLRDGRYLICGGEYVSDRYELAAHDPLMNSFARCEIYDPTTFSWTEIADMPALMRDEPAVELSDGTVMILSAGNSSLPYLLSSFGQSTPTWTAASPYVPSAIINEGDCLPQHDGNVFCGIYHWAEYLPGSNVWNTGPGNGPADPSQPLSMGTQELGPMLLLYDGRMMVLGSNATASSNATSAIFTPPAGGSGPGSWQNAANLPANVPPLDHGDTPAAVMRDGRVLVTSGGGNATVSVMVLHEYDPATNTWKLVPSLPVGLAGEDLRMLALPNGQVLVTGTSDGSMWLYTPSGTPNPSWRPTITSITGPASRTYTLTGTQLNGLTTGATYGDDAKMATNYPIVYLTDSAGDVFYARTFNFSSMTPAPSTSTCQFTLPPNIPSGTYNVHVSANGLDSDPAVTHSLTVSGIHVAGITVTGPLTGTVTLSAPAPAAGLSVTLVSSDPNTLSVPAAVNFLFGRTSANFTAHEVSFGTAMIWADTFPTNASFPPVAVRMGWTIQSLTGPSVVYGDRGAATTLPWLVTFSAALPSGATLGLNSGNGAVATVGAGTKVAANALSINVIKAGGARGLASITTSINNSSMHFTFSDRDTDFYKCADEGGTCAAPVTPQRLIAFGANGVYEYQLSCVPGDMRAACSTGQFTPCNTALFTTNPSPGASRACYLSTYGWLATDDGGADSLFTVTTPTDVAYGADTGYSYGRLGPGSYECNGSVFNSSSPTDPVPGYGRFCLAGPDQVAYTYRGDEGVTLFRLSSTPIAYGGAGHFVFQLVTGTLTCNTATFGDPSPGSTKSCYTLAATRFVADEGQSLFLPPGTTLRFGSGLNGNFLLGTISGMSTACTAATFGGGDPDPGQAKHCWIQSTTGRTFQEVDLQDVFVLDTAGNLSLDHGPFGPNPPTSQLVDDPVLTFQALDLQNVFVLGRDGNLWFEHGPFVNPPPTREPVDGSVVAFQALDSQHVLVQGFDQNLWLEQTPFGPSNRVPVDAKVQSFAGVTTSTVAVLRSDASLWMEQSPFGSANSQQIDAGVLGMQPVDTQHVYELKTDHTLWLAQGPFGAQTTRQQVDAGVVSFRALDQQHVAVLANDGTLRLDQGPFGSLPPAQQLVDSGVVTFQAIDQQHMLVLDSAGNLWFDQAPFPGRQQVDSFVAPFSQLGQ